ncbi:germin-like protein subfamily 3 member 4 [Dorcoceras hygrometricum]|uniref:Germin-like protein subfamily 3 member 4 n=1 Tax=Dorcoceras hygrometricum TaxID=472368 RepID=A0A2Z7CUA2_9LAMI|nr:germin-like protein subfamily 3 member 4 [Dorcoceras hygrometricum]
MSLFDLQDVCIAIGSIATLDLPMVVDLIGIYGLKGPYCTLTTTNWFLQALSVIPRGSWGDVSRCFTMIRWAVHSRPSLSSHKPAPPPPPRVAGIRSGQFGEENPFVLNLSVLLVQADKGISVLVVDRIGDIYRSLPRRADVIVTTVGARHKCQQGSGFEPPISISGALFNVQDPRYCTSLWQRKIFV